MPATFSIGIFSDKNLKAENIEFFNADEWTKDSEMVLVQKLYQILNVLRPLSTTIRLHLETEVCDIAEVVFHIKKKINSGLIINTQKLSVREIEIVGLVMQGYTNHEIAEKLFISYETVKSHRKHILLKTGAKNTAALINYYHQTFFDK